MNTVYDVVVIGSGVNGSCAALHAAKSGKKTALLEQFPLPNDRSSSNGQSRFFRFAHFSPDSFSPIVQDSYNKWIDIQTETKKSILRKESAFFFCKDSKSEDFEELCSSVVKCGFTPITMTSREFNQKYKTNFDDDLLVLEDDNACVLMASKSVDAIQGLFVSYGGVILDEYPVTSLSILKEKNNQIVINGAKRSSGLEAKAVVICAGAWTNHLLRPLGINLPIEPTRVAVLYWPVLDKTRKTFAFVDNSNICTYGLPDIEYPGLVKLSYHGGVPCDPSQRDLADLGDIVATMKKYIRKTFPWLGSEPAITESCMYTLSPDKEMILDQHPVYKNISFGCGFSGTGFKSGPTVGQILTEMATGEKVSFNISDFRMNRFQKPSRTQPAAKL